jgi:predicted O-methyltransferase YrrM
MASVLCANKKDAIPKMSYTLNFFSYLLGRRSAFTHDTGAELMHLAKLAACSKTIIEVGVFEGVASRRMCEAMPPSARLYLIDPYFQSVRTEKLLNFSFTEYIARRTVQGFEDRIEFLKQTSMEAFQVLQGQLADKADLIFIDARHDYASVYEDFEAWSTLLSHHGVLALHDSHPCPARADLDLHAGPVQLSREIANGKFSNWRIVEHVDSITVVARAT